MEQKKTTTTGGAVALLTTLALTGCVSASASTDLEDIPTGGDGGKTVEDSGDNTVSNQDQTQGFSEIEVSVDGGESWHSDDGVGVFALADIFDFDGDSKSEPLLEEATVDGFVEKYFQVRTAEGESSVISPENVSVVYTGDDAGENHYDFYIESVDGLDIEGAIGSGESFTEDGEAVIPADGSAAEFVVGVYADEHVDVDVDADFELIAVGADTED